MSYSTVEKTGASLFKDKNSKFFGYSFEVNSEDEVKQKLDTLSDKHYKARHLCYAYRVGAEDAKHRINDDGEPSGSAGSPIFNKILSADLNNILVVVVRYFGGTKLGIPGLINAYGTAAEWAIIDGGVKEVVPQTFIKVKSDYFWMGKLMDALKSTESFQIIDQNFESEIDVLVSVEKGREEEMIQLLKSQLAGVPFDPGRDIELKGFLIELDKS